MAGTDLTAIFAGLNVVAVANEQVIAHPYGQEGHVGHTTAALSLLLFSGPALFLLALAWYMWAVPHVSPRPQLVGCGTLALLGIVSMLVPHWITLALVAVVFIFLALFKRKYERSS